MTATEFRKAVKEAKRIIAYVSITSKKRRGVVLAKGEALNLIKGWPGTEVIRADWLEGSDKILLVGF